ncbi:3-methyladenine DNA glycosylase [Planctomycetes bacterium CA13]|uniref:Putative 3-methyladenine DNA glycosylase n=1 Tax=Novipirellula herctigrandis TaxID=2527986 RepID=A0A5C5Z846_9BACT|nr:3-methyladenine DNA glycosylase [Planctomycetes bacterium CA13]
MARDLLGMVLLRRIDQTWIGGSIVETEAYLAMNDPSSHSYRGKTKSNASMFGPAGTLYVYPIHGKFCMNAVTERKGVGSAVLIRAIEPVWGISQMQSKRGYEDLRRLTRGPAMLCQALSVDRQLDSIDLTRYPALTICEPDDAELDDGQLAQQFPSIEIAVSPRIGISRAVDEPLRFFVRGNCYVSGRKKDHL